MLEDSRSFDVEYLDVVDDEQLTLLYSGCRGVMLPSLYEGFGLSLVEAFAFGKPVITANLSSLPEVAGDAGLLVNPYDTAEITQAILNLCLDEQLYEKLSRQATLRHKLFSWEKAATQTYKVIKQLL